MRKIICGSLIAALTVFGCGRRVPPTPAAPPEQLTEDDIKSRQTLLNAIDFYTEKLKTEGENPNYYYSIGVAYFRLGDLTKADEYLEKSLRLRPDNIEALVNKARIAEELSKDGLTDYYLRILKHAPFNIYAHTSLAKIYYAEKKYGNTIDHFEKIESVAKNMPEIKEIYIDALYQTAIGGYNSGNFSESLSFAEKASSLDENENLLRLRILNLMNLKQYESALELLNKYSENYAVTDVYDLFQKVMRDLNLKKELYELSRSIVSDDKFEPAEIYVITNAEEFNDEDFAYEIIKNAPLNVVKECYKQAFSVLDGQNANELILKFGRSLIGENFKNYEVYFYTGKSELFSGNLNQAENYLKKALEFSPTDEANLSLAGVYFKKNNYIEALNYLEKIKSLSSAGLDLYEKSFFELIDNIEDFKKQSEMIENLIKRTGLTSASAAKKISLNYKQRNFKEVTQTFEEAQFPLDELSLKKTAVSYYNINEIDKFKGITKNPAVKKDENINYYIAQVALKEGRKEDFTEAVKIAVNSNSPDIADAAYKKYINFLKTENRPELEITVLEYLKRFYDDEIMNILGGVYFERGEWDKAVEVYLKVLEKNPDNFQAAYKLAECYEKKQDSASAIKYWRAVAEKNPESFQAHYYIGLWNYYEKNYLKAAENFREALSLKPDLWEARYSLGLCYLELKNPQAALKEFDKLNKNVNKVYESYLRSLSAAGKFAQFESEFSARPVSNQELNEMYLLSLYEQKKYKAASEFYEKNENNLSDDEIKLKISHAFNQLGADEFKKGNFQGALINYRKSFNLNKENYDSLKQTAECLFNLNRFTEASETALDYMKKHPDDYKMIKLLAESYKNLNMPSKAADEYEKLFRIGKTDTDDLFFTADFYLNEGQTAEAVKKYESALSLIPNSKRALFKLKDIYLSRGDYKKAIEYLTNLITVDSFNALVYEELGFSYYNLKDFDNALNYYLKALKLNGKNFDVLFNTARIYKIKGDINNAEKYFKLAYEINSGETELLKELSEVFISKLNYSDAEKILEKLLEGEESSYALSELKELYIKTAEFYMREKQYTPALLYIEKSIKLDSDNSQALILKGRLFFELGKLNEALSVFTRAVERYPLNPVAHLYLGKIYQERDLIKAAISSFERAAELNPSESSYYTNLAVAYSKAGMDAEAYRNFQKALSLNEKEAASYFNLGVVELRRGNFDRAIVNFQKTLSVNPEFLEGYLNLAFCYNELGFYDKAEEIILSASKIAPDNFRVYFWLGMIKEKQNQPARALEHYLKSYELNSNNGELNNNIGEIFRRFEDYPKAINHFKRALKDNSFKYHEFARNNLGNIYYEQGLVNLAVNEYTRAIELNSTFLEPKYNLAKIYHEQNQIVQSMELLSDILRRDPLYDKAYYYQALNYLKQGNNKEALSLIIKAVNIKPENKQYLNLFNRLK